MKSCSLITIYRNRKLNICQFIIHTLNCKVLSNISTITWHNSKSLAFRSTISVPVIAQQHVTFHFEAFAIALTLLPHLARSFVPKMDLIHLMKMNINTPTPPMLIIFLDMTTMKPMMMIHVCPMKRANMNFPFFARLRFSGSFPQTHTYLFVQCLRLLNRKPSSVCTYFKESLLCSPVIAAIVVPFWRLLLEIGQIRT